MFVCTHWGAWRKGMEAIKPWDGSGQRSRGPSLHGLGAPPPQDCRPLSSARQVSTSARPSPGGKACHCGLAVDPTSCLYFSQLWNTTKKQPWAGDCFLGREPQVLSTIVGRSSCIVAPGPTPVCASFEMHAHSQITSSRHTDTHTDVHKHISKPNRSAEFVTWSLLHIGIQVSHERGTEKLLMVGLL